MQVLHSSIKISVPTGNLESSVCTVKQLHGENLYVESKGTPAKLFVQYRQRFGNRTGMGLTKQEINAARTDPNLAMYLVAISMGLLRRTFQM